MVSVETRKLENTRTGELLEIIVEEVMQCKDTQIYISNELLTRIIRENEKSIIWKEDVVNSFQYGDNVEKSILFSIKRNNNSDVFQMHYTTDNIDFIHLSYLASKGIMYCNYKVGMKRIIIFSSD